MRNSLKLVCMVFLGASMTSVAQAREFADIYTECGLGALIAPRNEAVAAVTNVTWDLGTTAISSDVSSPENCKGGQAKTAALIFQAYPSVETDLAQGQGEHLSALLNLAGCEEALHATVSGALRTDFGQRLQVSGITRYDQAQSLYLLVERNTEVCADA